jgi:hypothetical protein
LKQLRQEIGNDTEGGDFCYWLQILLSDGKRKPASAVMLLFVDWFSTFIIEENKLLL